MTEFNDKHIVLHTVVLCQEIRVHPQYTRVAISSFDSRVHPHRPLISPRYSYYDYDGNALADWVGRNIL